jgi:hypothetical protein
MMLVCAEAIEKRPEGTFVTQSMYLCGIGITLMSTLEVTNVVHTRDVVIPLLQGTLSFHQRI